MQMASFPCTSVGLSTVQGYVQRPLTTWDCRGRLGHVYMLAGRKEDRDILRACVFQTLRTLIAPPITIHLL